MSTRGAIATSFESLTVENESLQRMLVSEPLACNCVRRVLSMVFESLSDRTIPRCADHFRKAAVATRHQLDTWRLRSANYLKSGAPQASPTFANSGEWLALIIKSDHCSISRRPANEE